MRCAPFGRGAPHPDAWRRAQKASIAMAGGQVSKGKVKLTQEQEHEGYWVEEDAGNVLVWHNKNQIALLLGSADIERKAREVVEKRRKELREVEARTGWKSG